MSISIIGTVFDPREGIFDFRGVGLDIGTIRTCVSLLTEPRLFSNEIHIHAAVAECAQEDDAGKDEQDSTGNKRPNGEFLFRRSCGRRFYRRGRCFWRGSRRNGGGIGGVCGDCGGCLFRHLDGRGHRDIVHIHF